MPYERDPRVLGWFESALTDERPRVRRCAIELLRAVDCPARSSWLRRAAGDPDAEVAATALIVEAALACEEKVGVLEMLESDLADGLEARDLTWEWEYRVRICRDMLPSSTDLLVWTRVEDDASAKERALMKVFPGIARDPEAVAVIVDKRLVNQYTRAPRSMAEARTWRQRGRPRYLES